MKKLWIMTAIGALSLWGQGGFLGCDQAWRFNPCGTILSTDICTPESWYARLFTVPQWNIDPSCPIPYQCGDTTTP